MTGTENATSFVEPLLWRQAPEKVEQLIRAALTVGRPISDALRTHMEVALAYALMHQHRFQAARSATRAALQRSPGDEQALMCEAQLAFFMDEPWPGPWDKFEARWAVEFSGDRPVPDDRRWDGSPLNGRSVLLAGEGGLGDQVQFVRFATSLKAAGAGRVIVSAHPPLIPLFGTMAGIDAIVPTRMPSNTLEVAVEYDVAIPMLSAPRYVSPALNPWPQVPYLRAPPEAVAVTRRQFKEKGKGFNVGLCWHSGKAVRRIPLEMFRPLAEVPGVRLFALGEQAAVQKEIAGFPIVDVASDIQTTAAAITALDLVISVDTMVAHLAGALGRPTWVLLHYLPDWRWSVSGESTAWYPTMRLFREQRRDWEPVIDKLAAELRRRSG